MLGQGHASEDSRQGHDGQDREGMWGGQKQVDHVLCLWFPHKKRRASDGVPSSDQYIFLTPHFDMCSVLFYLLIYYINLFIYLFMAVLGLRCCARAFSSCGKWGLLFIAVRGLLIVVASRCRARALCAQASVVVAHGLSCSAACGIFPDQDLNPCPLHWQADS